jgi:hypothetical protein
MRRVFGCATLWLAFLGPLAATAAAQLPDQSFEVVPEVARAAPGEPVSVRFRVRLGEGDLLYDTVPKPMNDPPPGVRVLSAEKLQRGPDRIFTGRARVAFDRTGRQAIPVFGLPFMRSVKGVTRATLASDSAFIEIEGAGRAGNTSREDDRRAAYRRSSGPLLVAGALVASIAMLAVLLRRRRRAAPPTAGTPVGLPAPTRPRPVARDPYDAALARLAQLDRDGGAPPHHVDRHYAAVAETLRRYLAEAHGVPAPERTTGELMRVLPRMLGEAGRRERLEALLGEADLVKFARVRPDARTAERFAGQARALLDEWHAAAAKEADSR